MTTTFKSYHEQSLAASTPAYPGEHGCLVYAIFGLAGEVGELVNKVKKEWRATGDHDAPVAPGAREAGLDELGDVLWYAARVAEHLGATLEEVAARNVRKLEERKKRKETAA